MLEIRFFNYICDDVLECHDKIIIRKRFAYLANENLRNFQRMQEITKWFSRLAWAAIFISCIQGFLRTIIRRCGKSVHVFLYFIYGRQDCKTA